MNPAGLQLYTVRDDTSENMEKTLRAVRELGYQTIELAGFGNSEPGAIHCTLEEIGLTASAAHISLDDLEHRLDEVFSEMRKIGCTKIVCPYLPEERRMNAKDYHELASLLNQIDEACKMAGFMLVYHHHDFEFLEYDGKTGMDILLNETSLSIEADVYWLAKVGLNPGEWIKSHHDRIVLLHLKDMNSTGDFAVLGEGDLDLTGIMQAAQKCHLDGWFVEQDESRGRAMDDVAKSMAYLKAQGWA